MKENEEIKVNPPQISEETQMEMVKFFMKTSVLRILAERKAEEAKKKEE